MATISEALAIAVRHHQAGRLQAAEQLYRRVLSAHPNQAEAFLVLNNLGLALCSQGRLDDAVACFKQAVQLEPRCADAHNNLGTALHAQGHVAQAIACYQCALNIQPDLAGVHNNLANAWKDQGLLPEAIASYRRALELRPDYAGPNSNLLYTLHFCPEYDAQTIFEEHRRWNQLHAQPLAKFIKPHDNDRSPNRRLRVGYVSPNYYRHCQALFTTPLLAAHDHKNYEIFCYAEVLAPDEITGQLRSHTDVWRDIRGLTDAKVADLVRQDGIDILVDLTMHMEHNRLLVFARKPAPVQVSWLAYPGTTGLSAIDYRLTDPYLDPPGLYDRYYSEKSIRLPDSFWCYDPLTSEPAVNGLPALKNGFLTFGCLNNFCKINTHTLQHWARVLRATGSSRLILLSPEGKHRNDVLSLFGEEGIAADRVTFVVKQPRAQYLELYHRIDAGLDTLPYNGHTTSLDAAWMGVPVITVAGQTVVGRAGVSQLVNLGLRELIASNAEELAGIAADLASDLPHLSALRASLRERMRASPLMDAPRFARAIEAAYRDMWHRWSARSIAPDGDAHSSA